MAALRPRATENECLATIVHAAQIAGYRVNHQRPAITKTGYRTAISGHAGAPDLLIVGHGRVIVAELKRTTNWLTPEQVAWRDALLTAGADWRLVLVPDETDAFIAELVNRRTAA